MYKLIAKDILGVWKVLDLGSDLPAISYQANDLAELKDRQANYSQELSLPLSPANRLFFGLIDRVDNSSYVPYRNFSCRLFCNGRCITGSDMILTVLSVEGAVKVQLLGGLVDFFDTLGSKAMAEITEPYFTRVNGQGLAPASFPSGVEFCAASFLRGGRHRLYNMDVTYMLPVIKDRFLMESVMEANGYTWMHDLDEYPIFSSIALPVVTLEPDANSLLAFDVTALRSITVPYNVNGGRRYYIPNIQSPNTGGYLSVYGEDGTSNSWGCGVQYTAAFACSLKLTCRVALASGAYQEHLYGTLRVLKTPAGGDATEVYNDFLLNISTPVEVLTFNVDLEQGERLTVSFGFPVSTTATYTHTFSCSLSNFSAGYVPFYGRVGIPGNVGFTTQQDYFKAFVQRYGLTVYVDHDKKIVYTYTIKRVYDNKSEAKDWSNKLVRSTDELLFVIPGYAKDNKILMQDNDEDNVKDSGSFTVDNDTLEKSAELFTLPFEAGLDWGSPRSLASIPVFTISDNTNAAMAAAEYTGGKAHLVQISTDTISVNAVNSGSIPYHRVTKVSAQTLVDTFYGYLVNSMLKKAKMLTASFALTENDLEGFNPFIPVYLRQYGAYFYVNKVENFSEGKPTAVQLIRL